MPRLDGMGPLGQRAMVGRGLGRCLELTKEQKLKLLKENKEAIEKEIADLEQAS